jgi:hypothetical protein
MHGDHHDLVKTGVVDGSNVTWYAPTDVDDWLIPSDLVESHRAAEG